MLSAYPSKSMALSTMSLFPASDDVGFIHRVSVISTINERLGRFGNKPIVIRDLEICRLPCSNFVLPKGRARKGAVSLTNDFAE